MKTPFITKAKAEEIIREIPTPFHIYDEEGIRENEKLTEDEIKEIDEMLDNIPMSQVFGGSKVEK